MAEDDLTLEGLKEQIDQLRDLVSSEHDPEDGAEQSYPVPEKPVDDEMWAHLAKSWGSGIISYGGDPYRHGEADDVNNELTIYKADDEGRESGAVLEGFAHRMRDNVTLEVPAVSKETDYVIGVQYDPLREEEPVKLGVFTRPLDTDQGKKYIPIWEGTRRPSSVLSSVRWRTVRSRIAPTTTVLHKNALPDPRHSGLMWGTICYTYQDHVWYQLQWASEEGGEMEWVDITAPLTSSKGSTSTYSWSESARIERDGKKRRAYGRVRRANGGAFSRTSSGYAVWHFGSQDVPARKSKLTQIISGSNASSPALGKITFDSEAIRIFPLSDSSWFDFAGVEWEVD